MSAKPYELEKSLLDANKIQGLKAPSENAFHQLTPIPEYFLIDTAIPSRNIKPSFDFLLNALILTTPEVVAGEIITVDVLDSSSRLLFSEEYGIGQTIERYAYANFSIPYQKGCTVRIESSLEDASTVNAKLFFKRVFINEI